MDIEEVLMQNNGNTQMDCVIITHREKEAVLEYIATHTTVKNKNVVFIDRLLRVADTMLRYQYESISQYTERLFTFSLEGIKLMDLILNLRADEGGINEGGGINNGARREQISASKREQTPVYILKANLTTYAENAAKLLFKETKDLSWYFYQYKFAFETGWLLDGVDDLKSAYYYGFASGAAQGLFEHTKDSGWLLKCYSAAIKSGEIAEKCGTKHAKHSSHSYSIAGEAAIKLFGLVNDVKEKREWLIKAYDARLKSADIGEMCYVDHAIHSYSYAADAAIKFAELKTSEDEEKKWRVKAYDSRIKAADMAKFRDTKHSMHCYSIAGEIAVNLYMLTQDVEWARKGYDATITSAEMSNGINDHHSAHCYLYSGQTAMLLFNATHKRNWKKIAIECYQVFLDYNMKPDVFNGLKDSGVREISELQQMVEGLKRAA